MAASDCSEHGDSVRLQGDKQILRCQLIVPTFGRVIAPGMLQWPADYLRLLMKASSRRAISA